MFRIDRVLAAGLLLSASLGIGAARAATPPRTYPSVISGLGRLALPVPGGIEIVDGLSRRSAYIRVRGTPSDLT